MYPSSYDAQAHRILDRLRGYNRRSTWVAGDVEFIRSLLREWDEQVSQLQWRYERAEMALAEARDLNKWYEKRLVGRGFWRYVQFLFGLRPTPPLGNER